LIAEVLGLLEEAGYAVAGDRSDVDLPGGRKQTIHVAEQSGGTRLWSIVVSRGAAKRTHEGAFQLLRQNRLSELVEFTIDGRGR
jgi:hypothetical protein